VIHRQFKLGTHILGCQVKLTRLEYRTIMAVGERMKDLLEDSGQPVEAFCPAPGSVAEITPRVQETLMNVESWNRERGLDQIYLFL